MKNLVSNWIVRLLNKEEFSPVLTEDEVGVIKEMEKSSFISLLLFLNEKGYITNHDFAYEDVVEEFLNKNIKNISEEDELKIQLHNKREHIRHIIKREREINDELERAKLDLFIIEDRMNKLTK